MALADPDDPPGLGLRLAGWALLLLGLPMALLGATMPVNEYAATLGIPCSLAPPPPRFGEVLNQPYKPNRKSKIDCGPRFAST